MPLHLVCGQAHRALAVPVRSASMADRIRRGAEKMGEGANAARDAVGDRANAARDAVGDRASAAKGAAADAVAAVKPRLRGVSHQWAFFVSLVLGAGLILAADSP